MLLHGNSSDSISNPYAKFPESAGYCSKADVSSNIGVDVDEISEIVGHFKVVNVFETPNKQKESLTPSYLDTTTLWY